MKEPKTRAARSGSLSEELKHVSVTSTHVAFQIMLYVECT